MSLAEVEFAALRRTIATRGTVRAVLFPVTMLGWAALALTVLALGTSPVATLFPLAALVGGFEAIHALHVGVERVGRFLQVHYESLEGGPRWETAVMDIGPALPGGGTHPLFSVLFACAAIVNFIPALTPPQTPVEVGVLGLLHTAFIVRVARARWAAARQRTVELESFKAMCGQGTGRRAQPSSPNS